MATGPMDLNLLISQLPNMQLIAGPHHVPPEAQQALFGQLVAEHQRKDDQKVQVVDKKEGIDAMGRDTGGKNSASRHFEQRRKPPPGEDPEPNTQASNASPWAGNIINVKI